MSSGIAAWGTYLPFWRLQRSAIKGVLGSGGGRGTRAVASHDEDTTTLGVEAARRALAVGPGAGAVQDLFLSTPDPPYLDKTSATTVHAALGLGRGCGAYDFTGSSRSAVGTLLQALGAASGGGRTTLAVISDLRTGLAGSAEERDSGDGAAALLCAPDGAVAELIGRGAASDEFLDRWRVPGEADSHVWEERFGEELYVPLAREAFAAALKDAGLAEGDVDHAVVTGLHVRAVKAISKGLGVREGALAPDLSGSVGNLGAAQAAVALCDVLERAEPGQVIVVLVAGRRGRRAGAAHHRGADRGTGSAGRGGRPVRGRAGGRRARRPAVCDLPDLARPHAPRAPTPPGSRRPGAPTVHRSEQWKYAFAGSRCLVCGFRHMPPTRACLSCHTIDQMQPERLADVPGTVATFTIDHLAFSLSPPVVGVIVDFDGGGRYRCEMTDVVASELSIGDRVSMTFRRVWTAQGVHNYFWKARPAVDQAGAGAGSDDVIESKRTTSSRSKERKAMGSKGIRDQVAVIGMGCTRFGELWDKGVDDLLTDATTEAIASVPGLELADIDAFWLGTMTSGVCGTTLSRPLKIDYKPVTRVENYCATGSEAFRNACYAVASGAYDTAMAIGVEKLKDTGYSGLTGIRAVGDGTDPGLSSPAAFSFLAPSYAHKYGVDKDQMKEVMSRIAYKNHQNGARNPRAQFQKEVSMETITKAPLVAGDLGVFDCSGVSDGSAAAIICRVEDAHKYCDNPLYVKALAFVAGPAAGPIDPSYDYTTFEEVVRSAADAYAQAGITDPRAQLAMAEVHDCFTPTELVLMEDLGFAERGTAWKEVLAGTFDRDGELPVNPDGGLKSFGHPIGASGLRMLFECWLAATGRGPA